ncbi:MAG: MG2 domain-containing protein, partial [Gemmatimonadota bacterium]|nr:MG2 domain-containing protein [Gemmatimonadota bacterium]
QADLPRGCDATLLVPEWLEDGVPSQRWSFSTLGDLTLETVDCGRGEYCPAGPVHVVFSNPVSGAEVMRNVRILPQASFTVSDTLNEATEWYLNAELLPEKGWQVVVGLGLKDAFGQSITGRRSAPFSTTGFAPSVSHEYGHLLVEGDGFRTLPVQHVNVDSLWVATIPVPDSLENLLLGSSWGWDGPWSRMVGLAQERAIAMKGESNVPSVTGVPVAGWSRTDRVGTLKMMRVSMAPPSSLAARRWMTTSIVQVTDLGIHTKTGVDDLAVWVTGVGDGVSRPGVTVRLHDRSGAVLHTATTDGDGMVHFRDRDGACRGDCSAGYVSAELGDDRAVASVSAHGDELSPWRFSLRSAWGSGRDPVSVAVFTERGIYRPGEPLYAKTIVREGALGDLAAPAADSVRWLFSDREGGVLHQEVAALSEFGTADVELELSADMPLGTYRVQTQLFRKNAWQGYGFATYRVAEYRPPEFLVDVLTDDEPRMSEESVDATVVGRYLFGAPMAGAPVVWQVRQDPVSPWNLRIPGLEGWSVGVATRWWDGEAGPDARMLRTTTDTLGPDGRGSLRVTAPPASSGMPYRLGITGTVSDLNRQTASGGASVLVHPASFYVGARTGGNRWFWEAGQPVNVQVVTTAPTGERVPGVQVTGNLVRREWHRVRRTRDGVSSTVGSWVQDTVATCQVRTAAEPTLCTVTPPAGGSYIMSLEARDARGRVARTTFYRWASGAGWVPWWDSDQLEMDVILDRQRYEVGDTATVMLAAPFTDVEAWVTVERERILESRRVRITDGATTFRLPI